MLSRELQLGALVRSVFASAAGCEALFSKFREPLGRRSERKMPGYSGCLRLDISIDKLDAQLFVIHSRINFCIVCKMWNTGMLSVALTCTASLDMPFEHEQYQCGLLYR